MTILRFYPISAMTKKKSNFSFKLITTYFILNRISAKKLSRLDMFRDVNHDAQNAKCIPLRLLQELLSDGYFHIRFV